MSTGTRRPAKRAPSAARSAAAALAILTVAASLATSGCTMSRLARGVGLPGRDSKPPVSELERNLIEAREGAQQAPAEPYWPCRMAKLYLDADSVHAAEASLKAALARDPAYAPALSMLSKLYFDSDRHTEALRLLEPVRTRPEAFQAEDRQALLAAWALHQEALGRTDLAAEAIAAAPRTNLGRSGSALVYVMLRGESPDSAGPLARTLVRDDPNSAVNLNNYGITRLRAGDAAAARRAFQDAIGRDPALAGPYYNLAILERFYAHDDSAAASWFHSYWKRSHDDPDSLQGTLAVESSNAAVQKGIRR